MNRLIPLLLALLCLGHPVARAASAQELFDQAVIAERSAGDPIGAITLYEEVAANTTDRGLASRALLRMGELYEALGREGALAAYRRIIREFSDQRTIAEAARSRLQALAGEPAPIMQMIRAGVPGDSGEVSPDGRLLSFIDWSTGDLAVLDLWSGEARRVTNKGSWDDSPAFAEQSRFMPDGERIVFTWYDGLGSVELHIARIDQSERRTLIAEESIAYVEPGRPHASGDLVPIQVRYENGENALGILSIAGHNVEILGTFDSRHPHPVEFSADGDWLLFDLPPSSEREERDVFVVSTNGGEPIPVATHSADDRAAGFSSDDAQIIFVSDRSGRAGLWAAPFVNGRIGDAAFLQDLPEGRTIGILSDNRLFHVVHRPTREAQAVVLDNARDVEQPKSISSHVGKGSYPVWSANGQRLGWFEERQSGPSFVTRDVKSGSDEAFDIPVRPVGPNAIAWSPDEAVLAIAGRRPGPVEGFFLIDITTGQITRSIQAQKGFGGLDPHWSADGKTLYYLDVRDDMASVVAHRRDDASEAIVYAQEPDLRITNMLVLPGSRTLVLRVAGPDYAERDRLLSLDPDTGTTSVLLDEKRPVGGFINYRAGITLGPDSHSLLAARHVPGQGPTEVRMELVRVGLDDGSSAPIGLELPHVENLNMQPGGGQLAFDSGKTVHDLWVFENYEALIRGN